MKTRQSFIKLKTGGDRGSTEARAKKSPEVSHFSGLTNQTVSEL
jgi:hypothetical protein